MTTTPAPFLRWAGGKRRLLPQLRAGLPQQFSRLHEPFTGGGALAFALSTQVPGSGLFLNDINAELVTAYTVIRDDVEALITELSAMAGDVSEARFRQVRASSPETDLERAARMIYLNKTCFNGLYRVNGSGVFNVPWGKLKNPVVCDADLLRADSARLAGASITNVGFEQAAAAARPGDLVYFDPPYLPASPTASFSKYAKDDFRQPDHEELAQCIDDLTKRGVFVMLSNADTALTRTIYAGLDLYQVSVHRSIAAAGGNRGSVHEVIGVNYRAAGMADASVLGALVQAGTLPHVA